MLEIVGHILTTYDTLSGVLFALGFICVVICVLKNSDDNYDELND